MKKSTITLIALCVIVISILLPITVNAQDTTLTTAVPATHTLHLSIDGKGTVTVNGIKYTESTDIPIPRHSKPDVQVQSAKGYAVLSVTFEEESITHRVTGGTWLPPVVESDVTLAVVFEQVSDNAPTGDASDIHIAMLLFALSGTALVTYASMSRKKQHT